MQYLTFIALISSANAVPVVGGITKEIACKDNADSVAGTGTLYDVDCVSDATDSYKCYKYFPLGGFTATDWSDAADQCAALFDTTAGDRKCV